MTRASRSGTILLWVVASGLLVIMVWAFHRAFVTSSIRGNAQSLVESRICQSLAESAVAEMEARLGVLASDRSSPVFEALRRQVLSPDKGKLDLTRWLALEAVPAQLETPVHRGYVIERATCRVAFQQPIDDLPYEKKGVAVFEATVRSPGRVRTTRRRVELAREIQTTLVSIPRPFGNYGLFVADASGIADAARVNGCRDEEARLVREARGALVALRDRTPAPIRDRLAEILEKTPDPDRPDSMPEGLPSLEGAALYGLMWDEEPQPLDRIDLARGLERSLERARGAARALASLAAKGTAADATGLALAQEKIAQVLEPAQMLWEFHQTFVVLPAADPGSAVVRDKARKLDPAFVRRRAHYRIGPPAVPAGEIQATFDRLTRERTNGVILVENPAGCALRVGGALRGRMVVAVGPGGATVENLQPPSASEDLVTVQARTGLVRVGGRSRVSIVLGRPAEGEAAPRVSIDPGASIVGSLVMATFPPDTAWRGTLLRDQAQLSGFTDPDGADQGVLENYFVGLSPRVLYRRVVRP